MTLMLIALLIAGHHFEWYWLLGSVALDLILLFIKLNFLAIIVRRSVEEATISYTDEKPPGV